MFFSGFLPSFVVAASVFGVDTASAPQPERPGEPHAKPKLIAEHTAVRPGTKTWIGISFEIDDHWHIYWDGDGDTGQPVKAKFTLPPGCTVGEIVWPSPKRQVLVDTILDYIYEDKVTLLVPLEVADTVKPGGKLKIKATLDWMECSEECLPRKAEVTLDLAVVAASEGDQQVQKSPHAPRFEETRKRVPRSVEESAKVVQTEWGRGTLSLTVPGAKSLIFYPHRTSARLSDALQQATAKKDRLDLDIEPDPSKRVRGILEVVRTIGDNPVSDFYTIEVPLSKPDAAANQPAAPQK